MEKTANPRTRLAPQNPVGGHNWDTTKSMHALGDLPARIKTGPPIWPVSLLARRAQSDQFQRAGHGFQTPIELRVRTWIESWLEWSPVV